MSKNNLWTVTKNSGKKVRLIGHKNNWVHVTRQAYDDTTVSRFEKEISEYSYKVTEYTEECNDDWGIRETTVLSTSYEPIKIQHIIVEDDEIEGVWFDESDDCAALHWIKGRQSPTTVSFSGSFDELGSGYYSSIHSTDTYTDVILVKKEKQ